MAAPATVFTIGHSNRDFGAFVRLLRAHDVARVVDVRSVPRSRRWPWFARENLAPGLEAEGIAYAHAPDLGGLRKPRADSPNGAWEHPSFRGYADHMAAAEFQRAIEALARAARRERSTVMCAEAVPWRCHRRLVADALVARGHRVRHIMTETKADAHALTPFARVSPEGAVTYPDPQSRLPL